MTYKTRLTFTYIGILLLIFSFFGIYLKHEADIELSKLQETKILWNVSINDTRYEKQDLQNFSIDPVDKGDIITLSTIIGKQDIENPVLKINTIYTCIDAYSNNELIYTYGHDLYVDKVNVGCGYHFINLNKLSENNDIRIVLTVTEPKAFSSIKDIEIISDHNSYSSIINNNLFIFSCDIFLIFLGSIGILISAFFLNIKKKIYPIIAISLFSLSIGIGSLCNNNFIQIFSSNFTVNSYFEYIALYGSTLSLTVIFYYLFASTSLEKKLVKQYGILFSLYVVIALVLQLTKIAHLQNSLNIYQIITSIGLLFAMYLTIKRIVIKKSIKESFLAVGILVLILLCSFDLLRYVIFKYIFKTAITMKTTLMSLGTIIFIITTLIQYFYIELNLSIFKENSDTQNLAHNRLYPGIYTKESFNNILQNQESFKANEYSIITFDIDFSSKLFLGDNSNIKNRIKSDFAKNLFLVFSQYGRIAKTGSSQFSVIAPFIPVLKLKQLISTFNMLINEKLLIQNPDVFKFRYGYAFSYENIEQNSSYLLHLSRVKANLMKLN